MEIFPDIHDSFNSLITNPSSIRRAARFGFLLEFLKVNIQSSETEQPVRQKPQPPETSMTSIEREKSARIILSFLDGSCGPYDWDDFVSPNRTDPQFRQITNYCIDSQSLYPALEENEWCNDQGANALRHLVSLLNSTTSFQEISQFIQSEYDRSVSESSSRKDDPWGLDSGVTPTSIGGAFFQSIVRLFRSK